MPPLCFGSWLAWQGGKGREWQKNHYDLYEHLVSFVLLANLAISINGLFVWPLWPARSSLHFSSFFPLKAFHSIPFHFIPIYSTLILIPAIYLFWGRCCLSRGNSMCRLVLARTTTRHRHWRSSRHFADFYILVMLGTVLPGHLFNSRQI